jgi:transposase InsO family protein
MLENSAIFSVEIMACVLQVSRSGYYYWRKNKERISAREQRRMDIDESVSAAFTASKERYGAERIFVDLSKQECPLDIKTIAKSLKRQGLVAKAARLFKVTTDSDHSEPIAENLLARDFSASKPNEKWVSDITYIQTTDGWLYLAMMIDLFSRKVIGWSMSETMEATLVADALKMALARRNFPRDVIVHSDRGSQYASKLFRGLLSQNHLQQSMSRKGNCWDNACAESFFHSLKVELLYGEPLMSAEKTREVVFEYIEIDYNRNRRHSANAFVSPEQFEEKFVS